MGKPLFRYIQLLIIACIVITVSACSEKHEVPEPEPTPQTLIVYMVGTSLNWAFDNNKDDIVEALNKNIKGQSRVIIVRHTDKQTLQAIEIEYNNGKSEEKEFATYTLPTSMDQSTLSYIFKDITSRAAALSYGLIIGSHGWGWIPIADYESEIKYNGMARSMMKHVDRELPREYITRFLGETSTPSNIFDVKTLSEALSATGKKFEYILFDACFMANVETLFDLRYNTKYVVASLCEIMGKGFPYEQTLPHLLKNGGKSYDLNMAAKSFHDYYKALSDSGSTASGSVAVIDCAGLDALAEQMGKVNQTLNPDFSAKSIQTYEGGTNHIFYDLGDYVNKACSDEQNKTAFMQQLQNCVVAKYTLERFWSAYINQRNYPINTEVFSGMTTSAPSLLCRKSYAETSWYQATH